MIEKVYVTKYALTDGVRLCKVLNLFGAGGALNQVTVEYKNGEIDVRLGSDAFVAKSDAADRFEDMTERAIKSAEKKLERLRAMKFEVKE